LLVTNPLNNPTKSMVSPTICQCPFPWHLFSPENKGSSQSLWARGKAHNRRH